MALKLTKCPFCGGSLDEFSGYNRFASTEPVYNVREDLTKLSNPDFEIEDDTLFRYSGKSPRIEVPQGVKIIGTSAFEDNLTIEYVKLPDTVEIVGDDAFLRCANLREIILSANLKVIEDSAFFGCSKLLEVSLPTGLEVIGLCAFAFSGLKKINLPESLVQMGQECFSETKLEYIKIPSGIDMIPSLAFAGSKELREVVICEGVTGIEENAFAECKSLKTVTIPDSISYMGDFPGDEAFSGSDNITTVNASNKWKSQNKYYMRFMLPSEINSENYLVEDDCLERYYGRDMVPVLPGGITEIGGSAFAFNSHIQMVTIPESVRVIHGDAFRHCPKLKYVFFPDKLSVVNPDIFNGCKNHVEILASDEWKLKHRELIEQIRKNESKRNI